MEAGNQSHSKFHWGKFFEVWEAIDRRRSQGARGLKDSGLHPGVLISSRASTMRLKGGSPRRWRV